MPYRESHLEMLFFNQLTDELRADVVRELRFAPPRLWRFDFAWPERKFAVEVEGGTYVQGRHSRPNEFEKDCEKYAEALILGWRVMRVSAHMVLDGRAIELAKRAAGARWALK